MKQETEFSSQWSRKEVKEFAIRNNHSTLFSCINVCEYDDNLSWEQAMQSCAVILSEQLKQAHEEIIKLHMERTNINIFKEY